MEYVIENRVYQEPRHTLRQRMIDARRFGLANIAECILFVNQDRKTISERGLQLSTGTLVHSEAYVRQCERRLRERLAQYLEMVRAVSEYDVALAQPSIH